MLNFKYSLELLQVEECEKFFSEFKITLVREQRSLLDPCKEKLFI